jgi:hypothetical protein
MSARIGLAACVAALTISALPALATTSQASLRVAHLAPLAVTGHGFKGREQVRLVLTARGATWKKAARAGSTGSFTASFPVRVGHCTGFTVQAIGSRGSRAILKRPPLPACMPE